MLEIKNLTKKYGEFTALDNISFTLNKGIYGLLGSNGAGKSTLMNLVTDNLKRTAGEVLYNGKEILSLGAAYREKIGYMPQLQGMYEDFSARDFLRYIGRLKGMKPRTIKAQTEDLLEIVGLSKKAHKKIASYSGGMRQRVLLASALLGDPEILILDEPTAGLDVEERIRLCGYISKLSRERTVIMATHIVSDIEAVADNVLLLCGGKLRLSGKPYEITASISGKICEFSGGYEEVLDKMREYPKGRILQDENGCKLRLATEEIPNGFERVNAAPTLDDVYLYYAEGRV